MATSKTAQVARPQRAVVQGFNEEQLNKVVEFKPFGSSENIQLTVQMAKTMLAKPTKQKHLPTDLDAFKFIMLCKARALNPFEGDAVLVGYDSSDGPVFSTITTHQALLKRAEACPEFDGMESGVVIENSKGEWEEFVGDIVPRNCKLIGGWCRIHHKNRKFPTYKRVDVNSYANNNSPFWQGSKRAAQVVKVTEADGLRSAFPNKVGKMYIEGENIPDEAQEQSEESGNGKVSGRVIKTLHQKLDAQLVSQNAQAEEAVYTEGEEVQEDVEMASPEQVEHFTGLLKKLDDEEIVKLKIKDAIAASGSIEQFTSEKINKGIVHIERYLQEREAKK